ncbi:hypothetical protein ACF0H5_010521 [Mactra antiquata]
MIHRINKDVSSQCSGTVLVLTATDEYQVFTSLNYPYGYGNDRDCVWRIEADNVTDAIRLEITDIAVEYHANCVYDFGEVFDGYNYTDESLGKFCGTSTYSFVSTLNYMTIRFKSDYSLYSKGFKARYKSGIRSTLLDDEEETSTISSVIIIGATIGAMALIVLIISMIFIYVQYKKAKDTRRNRVHGTTRVGPMEYGAWSYLDGPAPPAYGEIYSSPMSPPPQYSENDPNNDGSSRLPGRAEYMNADSDDDSENEAPNQNRRSDTNANTHFVAPNVFNLHNQSADDSELHEHPPPNREQLYNNSENSLVHLPGSVPESAQTTPAHHGASNPIVGNSTPRRNVSVLQTESVDQTQTGDINSNNASLTNSNNIANSNTEGTGTAIVNSTQNVSNSNTNSQNQHASLPNAIGNTGADSNDNQG